MNRAKLGLRSLLIAVLKPRFTYENCLFSSQSSGLLVVLLSPLSCWCSILVSFIMICPIFELEPLFIFFTTCGSASMTGLGLIACASIAWLKERT